MLISERRYPVFNGFLGLHNRLLAPLSLNEGQTVYITAEKFHPFPDDRSLTVPEIILSPFSPELWDDLWRIRIQFTPGFGRVAALMEFFQELGVRVLAAEVYEGGEKDHSQFNRFHLIVAAHGYESYNDGTLATRRDRSFARLTDLEDRLAVRFINELYFHHRRFPRLIMRRLSQHRILWRDVGPPSSRSAVQAVISKHPRGDGGRSLGIVWNQALSDMVKARGGETSFLSGLVSPDPAGAAYVMPTVDIEERFIRIITPTKESPFHYIKFFCNAEGRGFQTFAEAISKTRGNMVKLHLRDGIGAFETHQLTELGKLFGRDGKIEAGKLLRANITFSFEGNDTPANYISRVYEEHAKSLGRKPTPEMVRDDLILTGRGYDRDCGAMWIFHETGEECLAAHIEG